MGCVPIESMATGYDPTEFNAQRQITLVMAKRCFEKAVLTCAGGDVRTYIFAVFFRMIDVSSRLKSTVPVVLAVLVLFGDFGARAASDQERTPTFYRDVLPILQQRCQSCHRAGEMAPDGAGDLSGNAAMGGRDSRCGENESHAPVVRRCLLRPFRRRSLAYTARDFYALGMGGRQRACGKSA